MNQENKRATRRSEVLPISSHVAGAERITHKEFAVHIARDQQGLCIMREQRAIRNARQQLVL